MSVKELMKMINILTDMKSNEKVSDMFHVRWSDWLCGGFMNCPKCDNELSYDEVDIGVGLMKGNYHCDVCGWTDQDDIIST